MINDATASIHAQNRKGDDVAAVKDSGKFAAQLDGKQIVKEIYVPGRILNLIVK